MGIRGLPTPALVLQVEAVNHTADHQTLLVGELERLALPIVLYRGSSVWPSLGVFVFL